MALIQCPECSNQVSDSANACPHCGYKLKKNNTVTTGNNKASESMHRSKPTNKIIGIISISLLIVALIIGVLFNHVKRNNVQEEPVESSEIVEVDINEVDNKTTIQPSTITENTPYVDLGLPSGTKWKNANEAGLYTYYEAINKFGSRLPSEAQYEELINNCNWVWMDKCAKIIGPNGNYIFLPANGWRPSSLNDLMYNIDVDLYHVGAAGVYWASTSIDEVSAWSMIFTHDEHVIQMGSSTFGLSVRLVKN